MKNSEQLINDWSLGTFAIEKVNYLQQEFLRTPDEVQTPSEALCQAYEKLADEQKMAFILAGGVPSLFYYQQHHTLQLRESSDPETGKLPALC